jgi:hypothetical protein
VTDMVIPEGSKTLYATASGPRVHCSRSRIRAAS